MNKKQIVIKDVRLEDTYTIDRKDNVLLVTNVSMGERELISLSELDNISRNYFNKEMYTDFIPSLIESGLIN